MIEEKATSCICHLSHLHKRYSHSCHHRRSSTNKIIKICGLSAFPLESVVYFIQGIKCVHGSYVGETKQSLLTRMNSWALFMTGLNNPVSIRKALFPKHFWPPWQQKRNCLCNWNLTPEDDNSTKESLFPLTFVWKTEGCVYQWSGTKIGITYFFTCFICAIHFEIKVWYLKDLVKKSSLLQNWGPDRIKQKMVVKHLRKLSTGISFSACGISCILWLFTFKDK